jgi:hypothetical protein
LGFGVEHRLRVLSTVDARSTKGRNKKIRRKWKWRKAQIVNFRSAPPTPTANRQKKVAEH